jgi:hypothetical protein
MNENKRMLKLSGLNEGLLHKGIPSDIAKFFDELEYEVKSDPGFDMADKSIDTFKDSLYMWSFRDFDFFEQTEDDDDDMDMSSHGRKVVQRLIDTAIRRSKLDPKKYTITHRPDEKAWLTVIAKVNK